MSDFEIAADERRHPPKRGPGAALGPLSKALMDGKTVYLGLRDGQDPYAQDQRVRATLKRHGLRPVYRIERDGNGVGVLMWAEPILAPEP